MLCGEGSRRRQRQRCDQSICRSPSAEFDCLSLPFSQLLHKRKLLSCPITLLSFCDEKKKSLPKYTGKDGRWLNTLHPSNRAHHLRAFLKSFWWPKQMKMIKCHYYTVIRLLAERFWRERTDGCQLMINVTLNVEKACRMLIFSFNDAGLSPKMHALKAYTLTPLTGCAKTDGNVLIF